MSLCCKAVVQSTASRRPYASEITAEHEHQNIKFWPGYQFTLGKIMAPCMPKTCRKSLFCCYCCYFSLVLEYTHQCLGLYFWLCTQGYPSCQTLETILSRLRSKCPIHCTIFPATRRVYFNLPPLLSWIFEEGDAVRISKSFWVLSWYKLTTHSNIPL